LTARLSALATRWGGRCTGSTRILKDPCCYPLLAHLAQTGQILQLKNRPARCTTLRGAEAFPREVLDGLHARFGRSLVLNFAWMWRFFRTICSGC
jgi:hypothetical protein